MQKHLKKVLLVLLVASLSSVAGYAGERHGQCPPGSKLERAVSLSGMKFHQKMLMQIAIENNNNRAAGTSGYEASADYVAFCLWMTGYEVKRQEFEFPFFKELSDPAFQITQPSQQTFPPNTPDSFYTMTYSGAGDIEGVVVPIDVIMPPAPDANTSNSGCEPEDFPQLPAGAIVLIQRGACYFHTKAINAQNAGAAAVIIYNEGQTGRTDAHPYPLGGADFTIPVLFASHAVGEMLYNLSLTQEVTVRITTDTISELKPTTNILAATGSGAESNTIVVGAHLDSAPEGPGINDNGSGAAAVLEAAMEIGWMGIRPKHRVIFAFWGAEELGLLGSEYYVENLSDAERANIKAYLNFDMIGSPNYVRFVYDGDGSDTIQAGPAGSDYIEEIFNDWFARKGLPTDPTGLGGGSDYVPFMDAGIPVGGLFTGAGGIKTEEQAAIYGGAAGEPYDPNYHTAEDTPANINLTVERQMLKAMAHTVDHFANTPMPAQAHETRATRHGAVKPVYDYKGPLVIR